MRGGNRAKGLGATFWGRKVSTVRHHCLLAIGLKHPGLLDREWCSKEMRLSVRTNTLVSAYQPCSFRPPLGLSDEEQVLS